MKEAAGVQFVKPQVTGMPFAPNGLRASPLERTYYARLKIDVGVLTRQRFGSFFGIGLFLIAPPHTPIMTTPTALNGIGFALRRPAAKAVAPILHKGLLSAHLRDAILP